MTAIGVHLPSSVFRQPTRQIVSMSAFKMPVLFEMCFFCVVCKFGYSDSQYVSFCSFFSLHSALKSLADNVSA